MYTFWKARYFIGGVQKIKIGVPAFGAVHIFLSSPPCVGMRFLCFSTPLRRALSRALFLPAVGGHMRVEDRAASPQLDAFDLDPAPSAPWGCWATLDLTLGRGKPERYKCRRSP